MKVIKITGNTAFSERPAKMFSVLWGNVPMIGDAPSLGRSPDGFGVPCCGNHFLDHGYVSEQPCPSSCKFNADSFFFTTVKGLGSYLVVNLFWRFWSSSTWSPWQISEGVALCRLSMYDFALDFLKLSLEHAIWSSLEGRERSKQGILVLILAIHHQGCGRYPSGGMGIISVIH